MGQRERVRRAVVGPVGEAEKILAEAGNTTSETKLSILISGWGRGLAAGLEELALAIAELQRERPDTRAETGPTTPAPKVDRQVSGGAESKHVDLADASDDQLLEEAKRSREQTVAAQREIEDARRELE